MGGKKKKNKNKIAASADDIKELFKTVFGVDSTNTDMTQTVYVRLGNVLNAVQGNTTAIDELKNANQGKMEKIVDVPLFYGCDDEDPDEWIKLFE